MPASLRRRPRAALERFEGFIDKFIDDDIMAEPDQGIPSRSFAARRTQ